MIRADHIRRAMRSLGFKVSKTEAVAMVADIDLDRSGLRLLWKIHRKVHVCYIQWWLIPLICKHTHLTLKMAIDNDKINHVLLQSTDNTGKLTLDNLKRAAKESGVKFTEADLREMVEEADRNGDNMVDLQEFSTIMLKTNLF
eukprot:XP_011669176.1 PREDICTED: caltractin-like [Strongylocentrotus purpuratus]